MDKMELKNQEQSLENKNHVQVENLNRYDNFQDVKEIVIGDICLMYTNSIVITDIFLKILEKGPEIQTCEFGNAYIFGNLYKNGWVKINKYNNNRKQLCIMSMDDIKTNTKSDFNLYQKSITQPKNSQQILFIENIETTKSNINLYIHRNTKQIVDGIILDNGCIFV